MFKQRCFRLLLLASAIAASLSAAAYDFESAGIYYNITGNNTVEVTYSDRNNNTYSGSVSIPETVTSNGTEYSVTTIGVSAFKGSAVTSVSMPECITSIGQYACNECGSLETVVLPTNLDDFSGWCIFRNCRNLKNIAIPENVTEIPNGTFINCSSLAAITIPHGVSEIGSNAFYGCSSLTSIEIPEGVEYLYEQVFYGCTALESVKLPQNLLQIGNNCFYRCSSLENVTIPEGVTTIGNSAFYGCNLNALTLPSTVTSIGGSAFGNNNNLQSIICNAATPPTLGDDAFYGSNIQEVKVPLASIAAYRKAYGWKDFSNYYGGEMIADGITYRINEKEAMVAAVEPSLTEANIPSAVEFEGNRYLVIKINGYAFADNTNLTAVTLPDGLVEIGNGAFSGCI